jgi:hypothetical protein
MRKDRKAPKWPQTAKKYRQSLNRAFKNIRLPEFLKFVIFLDKIVQIVMQFSAFFFRCFSVWPQDGTD